jgi:hypothetical protein
MMALSIAPLPLCTAHRHDDGVSILVTGADHKRNVAA